MCEIQQCHRKPAEGLNYHVIPVISATSKTWAIVTDTVLNPIKLLYCYPREAWG